MHAAEIFEQRPVRGIAAQTGLPGVHMRVDQAGDDDAPLAVDDLGLGRSAAEIDIGTYFGNAISLDQQIAGAEIAE